MIGAQSIPASLSAFWSPWSIQDRPLYERRFAKWGESGSYETNFAYVQQECRDRAWKFVDDDLLITACARGLTSEFVFVLPPVGPVRSAAGVLPQLCAELAASTGRRVILRKLSHDLHEALQARPVFIPVPLDTYRNPRELPEDIHPQVVAPTRQLDAFTGSAFVKIRNNLRTARRVHEIAFSNLDAGNSDDVAAMINGWAREHNDRLRLSDSTGKTPIDEQGIDPAAYTIFCEHMAALVDDDRYFGRVMMIDGQMSAFTFAGRTARDTAGLYVSICRVRSRGTSECMIADMLDLLAKREITLLNLGGSEGEDLFNYKNKWKTETLISTYELEYINK